MDGSTELPQPPSSESQSVSQLKSALIQSTGSILSPDSGRITQEGKQISKSIFKSLSDEGISPAEVKSSIQQIRTELKASIKAHRDQLKLSIIEQQAHQWKVGGINKKGRAREFNAQVRETLAAQLAEDARIKQFKETRKLLTSLNRHASIQEQKASAAVVKAEFSADEVSTEKEMPETEQIAEAVPESTEPVPEVQEEVIQTQIEPSPDVDSQPTITSELVAERIEETRKQINQKTKKLGWGKLPIFNRSALRRLAAGGILLAASTLMMSHAPAQAEQPPSLPTQGTEEMVRPEQTQNQYELITQSKQTPEIQSPEETPVQEVSPAEPEQDRAVSRVEKADSFAETRAQIDQLVKDYKDKYGINISLEIQDITTGNELMAIGKDTVGIAASTAKLYAAATVLDAVKNGELSMNEKIGSQTVGELLSKMVNRSDNNAWEAFYKRLGSKRVENFARAHGAVNFNASSNMTTPEDLVEFLSSLYRGEILPVEQRNELLRLMKGGTTNQEDLLSPAMGDNSFFHKYGMYDTSLSDVGIVEIKGKPYAIAMTTNGMKLVDDNGLSKNNDMNIRTQAFHDIGQTAIQGLEHLQTVQ